MGIFFQRGNNKHGDLSASLKRSNSLAAPLSVNYAHQFVQESDTDFLIIIFLFIIVVYYYSNSTRLQQL